MQETLMNIAREAGSMILSLSPQGISTKGDNNFVTKADKDIQAFLTEKLSMLLPGSLVFGEEKDNETLSDLPTWVVDPIDGTLNYMRGLGHSAVSIGLAVKKQMSLGMIYDPFRDELFYAEKGRGALLNGKAIQVSNQAFSSALCCYGTSPYERHLADASFEAVKELMQTTAEVRRFGAAALDFAWLAAGRTDVFFEFSLSPWDYAAGKLLIEEAGGLFQFLNRSNETLDFSGSAAVCCANQTCFPAALEIVQRHYGSIGEAG